MRVVIFRVRQGEDGRFAAWQQSLADRALAFPGVLRVDALPADIDAEAHEWIVVYRFRSDADLQAWQRSVERAEMLAHAPDIFIGERIEYALGATPAPDAEAGETMVTSNEVSPEQEAEYEAADRALNEAAARFPGFVGVRILRPRAGSHTWSTLVRFRTKADLDRWLASSEREARLPALYRATLAHHASVVPTGFGSWFAVNAEDGIEAPAWKQAMIVLAALFPTVILLNVSYGSLTAGRLAYAVDVFIGCTLSIVALTWLLMPVVTRAMDWWLVPSCSARKTWIGAALLIAVYAVEVAVFHVALGSRLT